MYLQLSRVYSPEGSMLLGGWEVMYSFRLFVIQWICSMGFTLLL